MKKILIAAGGTGGHIVPALSIAEELKKSGHRLLFIGNRNSIEERLITGSGFDFRPIDIQKLYRKFTLLHVKFPFKLIKSIRESVSVIRSFQPDMFLGTGGFVSGPVGYAAKLKKVPILGDIPFLGELFRSHDIEEKRTNLYIFIRPVILREPDFADLHRLSKE